MTCYHSRWLTDVDGSNSTSGHLVLTSSVSSFSWNSYSCCGCGAVQYFWCLLFFVVVIERAEVSVGVSFPCLVPSVALLYRKAARKNWWGLSPWAGDRGEGWGRMQRGIPKKKTWCPNCWKHGLRVLIICNSAAREIGSEKRPLFLKLSNSLFNLIAARSRFSYKTQLFFLTILKIT